MAELNPQQRDAVKTLSGPLLVLAGAGTGKTRVVTYRIVELIRSGVSADKICAVTFTKKAAGEMMERTKSLLTKNGRWPKGAPRPEISTFHSLCVRILRRHIAKIGYPEKFLICDRGDQESQARAALREIKVPTDMMRPGDLLSIISNWKMKSLWPEAASQLAENDREHVAAAAYRRYQNKLKSLGMVDFDDLLMLTEMLFKKNPEARREEAARFSHLLVDEYQDTNQSQYEIVRGLASGHRNLCVVGDDDQSIYGWRGAEVTHILRFREDWPDAKVVRLEDNYRSMDTIIQYANTLIAFNKKRHDKKLIAFRKGGSRPRIMQFKDELFEAKSIVADILKQIDKPGIQPRDIAILFRTNEQPRLFETELRKKNVPYVLIGGQSFFDRKEVRDILGYLKAIHNPHDEPSLLRILNNPPRGIGDGTRKKMVDKAVLQGMPLWEALPGVAKIERVTSKTIQAVGRFHSMMKRFQQESKKLTLTALVEKVIQDTRYYDELARLYPNTQEREARTNALGEILNAAAAYDKGHKKSRGDKDPPSLEGFLNEIALGEQDTNDDKDKQLKRNSVALMTLHSAKGLEFPLVYLVGLEEGILPHRRSLAVEGESESIDEERRLCYVGVTRAKDRLMVSFALTRRKWGKAKDTLPSRFLFEMTGQADNPNSPANRPQRAAERHPSRAGKKVVGKKSPRKKSPTKKRPAPTKKMPTKKTTVKKQLPKKRPT